MAGCLQYFCAEWRNSRRLVLLNVIGSDALTEMCQLASCGGPVLPNSVLAKQLGLANWELAEEVALAGILRSTEAGLELLTRNSSVNTLLGNNTNSTQTLNGKFLEVSKEGLFLDPNHGNNNNHNNNGDEKTAVAIPVVEPPPASLKKKGKSPPVAVKQVRRKLMLFSGAGNQAPNSSAIFVNPAHPLSSSFKEGQSTREEFVTEVRKRLLVDRLFTHGSAAQPVFSVEEADDLFTTLTMMQTKGGAATLQLGRQLDAVVDIFFFMCHLREIVDRAAQSRSAFFKSLDMDKNNFWELSEVRHFLGNADADCLAALSRAMTKEGMAISKMADTLFTILDFNNDGKVELWELHRQISLAAPTRMLYIEMLSHLEMKHGLTRLAVEESASQLFERLGTQEGFDVSMEDAVGLLRSLSNGTKPSGPAHQFDGEKLALPLELSWGLDADLVEVYYLAMGCRMLMSERNKKQDACIAPEALLENPAPPLAALQTRFQLLWDRYGPSHGSSKGGVHVRDACFSRYQREAEAIEQLRSVGELDIQPERWKLSRSLFPNIGDVLAIPSTRLHSGMTCIIRYRLQGHCSFWHSSPQVFFNDKQAFKFPVQKQLLGDAPFIALVPRGLTYKSGNGVPLQGKLLAQVDTNMRVDLPRDPKTGFPQLFGCVELPVPSLRRGSRGKQESTARFEIRLFAATKQKILGSLGEPLHVQVVQTFRPPPVQSVQVSIDGRSVIVRWNRLDGGWQVPDSRNEVSDVRLLIRSDKSERTELAPAEATEWEVKDLAADTEYEIRARLENRLGPGRDAVAHCRTNALCAAPGTPWCSELGTTFVEMKWLRPRTIGNEHTKDRWQCKNEEIRSYVATLKIEEEGFLEDPTSSRSPGDISSGQASPLPNGMTMTGTHSNSLASPTAAGSPGHSISPSGEGQTARACEWTRKTWIEDKDGTMGGRLDHLRPDTRYVLSNLTAINSMGHGVPHKSLVFWTRPQTPVVASVRIKNGLVLLSLSQNGGACVKEYMIEVLRIGGRFGNSGGGSLSFQRPRSSLTTTYEGSGDMEELCLAFKDFPANDPHRTHTFRCKASNAGGWSQWSEPLESSVVVRQQGADQAQVQLISAIEARRIEGLQQTLEEVGDIEFSDPCYVVQATELLHMLQAAQESLNQAIAARDPSPLRTALRQAIDAGLPDLEEAAMFLCELEHWILDMESAEGLDKLQHALEAGLRARLPKTILDYYRQRLHQRVEAEAALQAAMAAARTPPLAEALKAAEGMSLPSERPAAALWKALDISEKLLRAALEAMSIEDLERALASAKESGLLELGLIEEASSMLASLNTDQGRALQELRRAMKDRNPSVLAAALVSGKEAQVTQKDLDEASRLLVHLEKLLQDVEDAINIDDRLASLRAAREAEVPLELLKRADLQLQRLRRLHETLEEGNVEHLRKALRLAEASGVKAVELAKARETYASWREAAEEVDTARALELKERLRQAVDKAQQLGIDSGELSKGRSMLLILEKRTVAENRLRKAIDNRHLEDLRRYLKHALDADVVDRRLTEDAHLLVDRLVRLRVAATKAMEKQELHMVYNTMREVLKQPGLPEKELQPIRDLLERLSFEEATHIRDCLAHADFEGNFRQLDALVARAGRARQAGTIVDRLEVRSARFRARELEQKSLRRVERELMDQREFGVLPEPLEVMSRNTANGGEETEFPASTVNGQLRLSFQHAGRLAYRFPREIVEGTLVVDCCREVEEGERMPQEGLDHAAEVTQEVIGEINSLIDEEDEVLCEMPFATSSDGKVVDKRHVHDEILDDRLDVHVSIYVRASHPGSEIVSKLCGRRQYIAGLLPPPASLMVPSPSMARARLASQATEGGLGGHDLRNVQGRIFRELTLDFSWHYAKGIMDIADCCCIMYDEERLVEIVDHRGTMGAKYGATVPPAALHMSHAAATPSAPASPTTPSKGASNEVNSINDSVRSCGSSIDSKERIGMQTMLLRLDLVPERVTDIFFVLSATNSRDLSKFSRLEVAFNDSEAKKRIVKYPIDDPGNTEACIMCSVYRAPERGLWRCNLLGVSCPGTVREYRPVLYKLLQLGYPRHASLRSSVQPILEEMRDELRVAHSVKPTQVAIANVSGRDVLKLSYSIEVYHPPDEDEDLEAQDHRNKGLTSSEKSRGSSKKSFSKSTTTNITVQAAEGALEESITSKDFKDVVVKSLTKFGNGSTHYTQENIAVDKPTSHMLSKITIECSWDYPESIPKMKMKGRKTLSQTAAAAVAAVNSVERDENDEGPGGGAGGGSKGGAGGGVGPLSDEEDTLNCSETPTETRRAGSRRGSTLSLLRPSGSMKLPGGSGNAVRSFFRAKLAKTGHSNNEGETSTAEAPQEIAPEEEDAPELVSSKTVSANYLDGTCVIFEGHSLREVADYRGIHGVRLVSNGVLDYGGTWLGKVGVADGVNGAIRFVGEKMDDTAARGIQLFEVDLPKLPRNVTDLFFTLSSPTYVDISQYSNLKVTIRDANSHGHQISTVSPTVSTKADAVVICTLTKLEHRWTLHNFGVPCSGNAKDYRPILNFLRRIQQARYPEMPQWPHSQGERLSLEMPPDLECGKTPRIQRLPRISKGTSPSSRKSSAGILSPRSPSTPRMSNNLSLPSVEGGRASSAPSMDLRLSMKKRQSRGGQAVQDWVRPYDSVVPRAAQ